MASLAAHYFSNKNGLLAVIPELATVFLLNNLGIPLPNKITNQKQVDFAKARNAPRRSKRVLILTEKCNMACRYCYEGNKTSRSMNFKMIQDIIAGLFEESKMKQQSECSIAFFGGEPTVEFNLLQEAVSFISSMEAKYGITCLKNIVTNGCFDDAVLRLLINKFNNIYVSFDGPEGIFIKQRGSKKEFKKIFDNCKALYNYTNSLRFKVIVTSLGVNRLTEIMDFFDSNFLFTPQMYQPVMIDCSSNLYVEFGNFLRTFAAAKCNRPTSKIITTSLFKNRPSIRMCNLPARRVIYPDGKIAACHRSPFDGNDQDNPFLIGLQSSQMFLNEASIKQLRDLNVINDPECSSCFARYNCGGGCPAIKWFYLKRLAGKAVYCEDMKRYTLFEHSCNLNAVDFNYLKYDSSIRELSSVDTVHSFDWLTSNSLTSYSYLL